MTLSIRLDPELEAELARAAAQTGLSKSELVKAGLREYLARLKPRKTPYELGADLFGGTQAGPGDLAALTHALAEAEKLGKCYLFRTAANFVAAYAGIRR